MFCSRLFVQNHFFIYNSNLYQCFQVRFKLKLSVHAERRLDFGVDYDSTFHILTIVASSLAVLLLCEQVVPVYVTSAVVFDCHVFGKHPSAVHARSPSMPVWLCARIVCILGGRQLHRNWLVKWTELRYEYQCRTNGSDLGGFSLMRIMRWE